MGTIRQRKDDKWSDNEAEGKRKEWGKRVDLSCAQLTEAPMRPVVQEDLSQCKAAKEGQGNVLAFATTKWGGDRACWSVDVLQSRIHDDCSCHSKLTERPSNWIWTGDLAKDYCHDTTSSMCNHLQSYAPPTELSREPKRNPTWSICIMWEVEIPVHWP